MECVRHSVITQSTGTMLSVLLQSGTELSANPSFSQLLISIISFGHGFPPCLGNIEGLLVFITGTKVKMLGYDLIGIKKLLIHILQ